jgi:single-stranded-DNA-specific exonuclease
MRLDNIEESCHILYEGFKNNKKFFLQVDSDTDGYTSSAIFYSFFKRLFPDANIEWRLHDNKEHGIILDTIPIDTDYVIIPDAGSMQFDEQEYMSERGYKVVIMDHHNLEYDPGYPNVYIVNNQSSPRFRNKNLSGAGVVYKTIQAFNILYEEEFDLVFHEYADLAALGIVSDMMDTRNLDNNFIIQKGLKNIINPMFKAIIDKQSFSIKDPDNPTKIDLAFYVAPLINAVIRFGTDEEKSLLFEGFITYDKNSMIETEYRGVMRKENYYDYVARTAQNIRGRQNREKEKDMNFLSQRVEENNLNEHQLLIVTISKDDDVVIPHSITGLVAMELLKKYKKPTLVLRPKSDGKGGTIYAGSGRGKANGTFDSLFGMLRKSNLCEYVEGHDMAHGVAIKEENLPKVIDFANNFLSGIEFDVAEYEVDFIFTNSNINYEMLTEFGKVISIYGNGIPQPKFAFDLNVAKDAIQFIGKKEETLKIYLSGVEFIKFKCADLVQEIKESNSNLFHMKFVGRAQINEWNNKFTPQIMIDDIEFEPITVESLF